MQGNPKHHPETLTPKMREILDAFIEVLGEGHVRAKRAELNLARKQLLNRADKPGMTMIPRWITRNKTVRVARGYYDLSVLAKLPVV